MKLRSIPRYGLKALRYGTFNKKKLLVISETEKDPGFRLFTRISEPKIETIYGFTMFLNPEKYGGSYTIFRDKRYASEDKSTALFLELIRTRSNLVVDIGANLGWFSLLAAKKGAKKVVSFEPDSQVNSYLEKSIAYNGFHNSIELNKICLMDYVGECSFTESISTNVGSSSSVRKTTGNRFIRKCSTLDVIFPHETIDIMKLDVEGAERRILKGAAGLLKEKRIMNMIIEYNHDAWEGEQEFVEFASDTGFKATKIVDYEAAPAWNYHLELKQDYKISR
jgi:FkbM family methyltransferase